MREGGKRMEGSGEEAERREREGQGRREEGEKKNVQKQLSERCTPVHVVFKASKSFDTE